MTKPAQWKHNMHLGKETPQTRGCVSVLHSEGHVHNSNVHAKHGSPLLHLLCGVTARNERQKSKQKVSPEHFWLKHSAFQSAAPMAAALLYHLSFFVSQLTWLQHPAKGHVHDAALLAGRPFKERTKKGEDLHLLASM